MYEEGSKCRCEALINGKRITFDAQDTGDDLESAKAFYKKMFRYVGTTNTVWYNDRLCTTDEIHHIFVHNNRTDV